MQGQYTAGDPINGFVIVNVTGEIKVSECYVNLEGQAKTVVHYTTGSGDNRRHHVARETQVFMHLQALIAKFDASAPVAVGQYQFPFTFPLPAEAQSSCFVQGRNSACVQYVLTVQLLRPGFMKRDMVQAVPIEVVAKPPASMGEQFTKQQVPVNCCCCIPRGTLALGARLNATAYKAGDNMTVIFEVQNESKTKVTGVFATLDKARWVNRSHLTRVAPPICFRV